MRSLFFTLAMLCAAAGFSQTRVLDDSTGKLAEPVYRGETLIVGYDTGYILNKQLFGLINRNIEHTLSANDFAKQLNKAYQSNIEELKIELNQKETFYQKLRKNYDRLNSATTNMVTKTNGKLNDLSLSLGRAQTDLDTVRAKLDLSLKDLHQQKIREWKFALGGFGVGVGVATIIFLLAR